MTPSTSAPRAAVIGSGFGGLALAIRLQAAGIPTTIFEQRDRPGGRAYVYHDQGFTFDAGPTVITAPHCLEELFEVADRLQVIAKGRLSPSITTRVATRELVGEWMSGLWPDAAHEEVGHAQA